MRRCNRLHPVPHALVEKEVAAVLKVFCAGHSGLTQIVDTSDLCAIPDVVWIDASKMSPDEERALEKVLAMDLDANADISHLPIEQPLQVNGHQMTMTALFPVGIEEQHPSLSRVIFLRSTGPLVTIVEDDGDPLAHFLEKYPQEFAKAKTASEVMSTILHVAVDDIADILDRTSNGIDRMNRTVFQHHTTKEKKSQLDRSPRLRNRQLEYVLQELGSAREILVKTRRSALSLLRLVGALKEHKDEAFNARRLETMERELIAVSDAEADLSAAAEFILDGVVGFIAIQQNKVVTILTVVNVVLTPPILIAGIYGMNFKIMPELGWQYGYLYSVAAMVVSGIAMYGFARQRGWL